MRTLLLPLLFVAGVRAALAQFPSGYVDEEVISGLVGPVGVTFAGNGHMIVWERRGKVWIIENGVKLEPPLLDIHDEVGAWRDYGLLGFALDPDFDQNGFLYAYYVVDRHHLLYYGTPSYDPNANEYFDATIGRVTRYTADPATGFHTVIDGSRTVLLGETADSGIPILHQSHGTGALLFGSDGTLLLSAGDAANYNSVDAGSSNGTYWAQALADGIIRPEENVGAFRAQMIGSLSGKILRIDPATGDGVPSNPFFDPADPRSPRSRVWALGLRNPFRFTRRPGTGSSDPAVGDPGVLYVGDVGWNDWEELHVVGEGGMNLGWPIFEGLTKQDAYKVTLTENQDAPNPLYDGVTCTQQYFTFQDLLKQEREDHNPNFRNPCDSSVLIPPSTPTFMHRRAAIEWRHQSNLAYVPTFENGKARRVALGDPGSPVAGNPFSGTASVGGVWLSGLGFGAPYKGLYFHADYSTNWIRAFDFDAGDTLQSVLEFGDVATPAFLVEDPADGSLIYAQFGSGSLRRIRYTGDGNVDPVAAIETDTPYGSSPLTLRLDGTGSVDPEGGALTFQWTLPGGATSSEPSPLVTLTGAGGTPTHETVGLTVTDPSGATDSTSFDIQIDNTPPTVQILGATNGMHYATDVDTTLVLDAVASDAEHAASSLTYTWQLFLHHESHTHPEEVITTQQAQFLITPTPCSEEFYAYRIDLTVSDPEGAATTRSLWLFPDCPWNGSATVQAPSQVDPLDPVAVHVVTSGTIDRVEFLVDGLQVGTLYAPPYDFTWTPTQPGSHMLTAIAQVSGEGAVTSVGLPVEVRTPLRLVQPVTRVRDDAAESGYDGHVVRGASRLDLGLAGAEPFLVALRLPLALPQGAKIIRAQLEFSADATDSGLAQLNVGFEASDDAAPLGSGAKSLSSRPRGAAQATWLPAPWQYPGARGARQRSVDLAPLIEELTQRPGWSAGNHAVLFVEGFGQRRARAFHGTGAEAPALIVEYQL